MRVIISAKESGRVSLVGVIKTKFQEIRLDRFVTDSRQTRSRILSNLLISRSRVLSIFNPTTHISSNIIIQRSTLSLFDSHQHTLKKAHTVPNTPPTPTFSPFLVVPNLTSPHHSLQSQPNFINNIFYFHSF